MERISRDTITLFNELKKELCIKDKEKHPTFIFCQIGQLLDHAFSIHYITGEKPYLKFKIWDTSTYQEGARLSFFNLDRLAIREKDFELSTDELTKIKSFLKMKFETHEFKGIILDGLFCQLIYDNTLKWNIDKEMNKALESLVIFLRKKVDTVYYNI